MMSRVASVQYSFSHLNEIQQACRRDGWQCRPVSRHACAGWLHNNEQTPTQGAQLLIHICQTNARGQHSTTPKLLGDAFTMPLLMQQLTARYLTCSCLLLQPSRWVCVHTVTPSDSVQPLTGRVSCSRGPCTPSSSRTGSPGTATHTPTTCDPCNQAGCFCELEVLIGHKPTGCNPG
jgi:hypothetical protein